MEKIVGFKDESYTNHFLSSDNKIFNFKINFKSFDCFFFFWILNIQKIFVHAYFMRQMIMLKSFFLPNYYQWSYFLEIFFFFNQHNRKLKVREIFYYKCSKIIIYFLAKLLFLGFYNYEFFQINWDVFYYPKINTCTNFENQKRSVFEIKTIKIINKHTLVAELKIFQDQLVCFYNYMIKKLLFGKSIESKTIFFELLFYNFYANNFFGSGKYIFFIFIKIFSEKERSLNFFLFLKQIMNECKEKIHKNKIENIVKQHRKILFKNLWIAIKNETASKKTIIRKKKPLD